MIRRSAKFGVRVVSLVLTALIAIGAFVFAKNMGWLSPIGIESESHDSQVIQAVERTQEVSLLSLSVQGIKDQSDSTEVLGTSIPGTGEKVFLQYSFKAKLGFDGADVNITKSGKNAYTISVPNFSFIGYAEPTFKVAAEDGGALSWVTPDIDKVAMVNEILNEDHRQAYITSNEDLLKEQTQAFYDRLITSIDPGAKTSYEFHS